jgi:hypothetical protein
MRRTTMRDFIWACVLVLVASALPLLGCSKIDSCGQPGGFGGAPPDVAASVDVVAVASGDFADPPKDPLASGDGSALNPCELTSGMCGEIWFCCVLVWNPGVTVPRSDDDWWGMRDVPVCPRLSKGKYPETRRGAFRMWVDSVVPVVKAKPGSKPTDIKQINCFSQPIGDGLCGVFDPDAS